MTDKIYVKDRDIVIPGEQLASGMNFLPSGRAFREDDKIYASTVGLIDLKGRVIKVIPLAGKYLPKAGDTVIGRVIDVGRSGWSVDIDCPFNADLNIGEASSSYIDLNKTKLTNFYDIGDYVLAGIIKIDESGFVKLTAKGYQYKKLREGTIIKVSPTKIPRIIGKAGSMISMLKKETNCDIVVGQNGLIWIGGESEKIALATKMIKLIETESHKSGLTNRIKSIMAKEKK